MGGGPFKLHPSDLLRRAYSAVENLDQFLKSLSQFHEELGPLPSSGSIVENDIRALGDVEAGIVLAQGNVLLEATADHAMALGRTLAEPVQTIAPFAIARSAMESAAICKWLLGADIDPHQRFARSLTWRLKGNSEQEKLVRMATQPTAAGRCEATKDRLRAAAKKHRLREKLSKDKKLIGFEIAMPSATDLTDGLYPKAATEYRIWSAVVHGHLWALIQVGFVQTAETPGPGMVGMGKALRPEYALHLTCLAAQMVAIAECCWVGYSSNGLKKLAAVLRKFETKMGLSAVRSHWGPPYD